MITNEIIQSALDKIVMDVMELKTLLRGNTLDPRVVEAATSKPANVTQPVAPVVSVTPKPVAQTQAPISSQAVASPAAKPVPKAPSESAELDTFDKLREALMSPKWPEAVNKNLVCDPTSDRDKNERGRGILELMIEEDLNGLKFADLGCGDGHCAFLAQEFGAKLSVGYDIKQYPSWTKFFEGKDPELLNKVVFTQDFDVVSNKGPYDIILLFDVLDHIDKEEPTVLLTKAASVLSDTGKIYMRTHPWTSRHATHLYHELNKAFIHLVFTEEELRQIVPYSKYEEPSIKIASPISSYENMIKQAKLKIVHRREIQEKVEPFFKIPKIAERITKNTKHDKFPEFQLGLQFIDYVIQKA